MQILAISGSLRARSSNAIFIEAASLCAPDGVEVVRYDGLGNLPLFNPDLDRDPVPPAVLELRALVGASRGLLICSPEYARGIAGAMKNALDWLVSSLEFPGKPVAVVNISPRATAADAHLRLTLRTMNARIVEGASIALPLLGRALDAPGILADETLRALISSALTHLRDAMADEQALSYD